MDASDCGSKAGVGTLGVRMIEDHYLAYALLSCFLIWFLFIGIGIAIAFPSLTLYTALFHALIGFAVLVIVILIVI